MGSERDKKGKRNTAYLDKKQAQTKKPISKTTSKWLVYGLISVMVFVFYGNSLNNGYSLDDELVTTTDRMQHRHVEQGFSAIPDIFTSRFTSDISDQTYSYRPLTTTTFAIEWALFTKPIEQGQDVTAYHKNRAGTSHAINLLIYIVCCILLYHVFLKIFGSGQWMLALLGTGLFLIHPIHTEVINNIKCRDELLCFAFGMATLLMLGRYAVSKNMLHLALSVLLLWLAVLSKESGMFYIGFGVIWLYYFSDFKPKQLAKTGAILASVLGLIWIFNNLVIGEPEVRNFEYFENPLNFMSFEHRIPMFFYCIFWCVKMLFFPHPLKYYYGYNDIPVASFTDPEVYAGIFIFLALCIIALRGLKQKTILSFATVYFLACIVPLSNLLLPMPGIVAERFLFPASFPFAVGVVFGLKWIVDRRRASSPKMSHSRIMTIVFIAIAVPSLVYVRDRNQDWDTKMSIFKADYPVLQNSAKALNLLATEYHHIAMTQKKRGDVALYPEMLKHADTAHMYFVRSAEIAPMHSPTWNNIGAIRFSFYFDIGGGISAFNESVKQNDKNYNAWLNLTIAWQKSGEAIQRLTNYFPSDSLVSAEVYDSEKVNSMHKKLLDTGVLKSGVILLEAEKTGRDLASINANQGQVTAYLKLIEYFMTIDQKYIAKAGMKEAMAKAAQRGDALYPSDDGVNRAFYIITRDLQQITGLTESEIRPALLTLLKTYSDSCMYAFEKGISAKPDFFPLYEIAGKNALVNNDIPAFFAIQRIHLQVPNADKARVYTQIGNGHHTLNQRDSAAWYYNEGMQMMVQAYQEQVKKENNQEAQRIQGDIAKLQQMLKTMGYQ